MASWTSLVPEEQLRCPICLQVFTQPASTPCGHNLCMSCSTTYWREDGQCPVCRDPFGRDAFYWDPFFDRPALKVNTLLSEVGERFRTLNRQQRPHVPAPERSSTTART